MPELLRKQDELNFAGVSERLNRDQVGRVSRAGGARALVHNVCRRAR